MEKPIYLLNNQCFVIWKSSGTSLAKAVEEVRETFENEKELLTVEKITFNQYDYTSKKLAEIKHRENVFVYDFQTFPNKQNADCVPYAVGWYPVSKISNSMLH